MKWRRILLSAALAGGCVWCLAVVQQVHSQEKTLSVNSPKNHIPPAKTVMKPHSMRVGQIIEQNRRTHQPG